jgi:hypothetical protein
MDADDTGFRRFGSAASGGGAGFGARLDGFEARGFEESSSEGPGISYSQKVEPRPRIIPQTKK